MQPSPEEPRCPFCYYKIEQPKELQSRKIVEFPVGVCEHCGVVYAYDATGHNMGAAFIEALLFACNEDNDFAFSLSYGDDYTDAVVGNYDIITHTIVSDKVYNDRYIRGALIFVKLFGQFQEATGEKVKKKFKNSLPINKTKMRSAKYSREIVRQYALENKREELIALAEEDTRVMNELKRMLYTPDESLRYQIIDMLGEVSKKVGERRPDIISKLLSNLLQSAAAPGSSAWGALETAGAIISTNPDTFWEFSPALLSFLKQQTLRKEVTWAIGKVAAVKPELVKYAFRALWSFLGDPDPAVRGYAAWALGNIGYDDVIEELKKLETDHEKLRIFKDGELKEVTVALLSKEALEKIGKSK
ncbi:MAG: DVU0298 family protein [Thermodesulfovibrionales bacterium]